MSLCCRSTEPSSGCSTGSCATASRTPGASAPSRRGAEPARRAGTRAAPLGRESAPDHRARPRLWLLLGRRRREAQRGKRSLALRGALAARLAREAQALEPRDLAFAFHARGVVRGEARDQLRDAVAQLQREVRGRSPHQLAHVLERDLLAIGLTSET